MYASRNYITDFPNEQGGQRAGTVVVGLGPHLLEDGAELVHPTSPQLPR